MTKASTLYSEMACKTSSASASWPCNSAMICRHSVSSEFLLSISAPLWLSVICSLQRIDGGSTAIQARLQHDCISSWKETLMLHVHVVWRCFSTCIVYFALEWLFI